MNNKNNFEGVTSVSAPSILNTAKELRVIFEMLAMASFRSRLNSIKCGDGHPVVVAPSFMTGDGGTAALRTYLRRAGFAAYGWEQGRNTGLREQVYLNFERHIKDLAARYGKKVSVVGWSLGGVYARTVANKNPDYIRQIITLGSPIHIPDMSGVTGPVLKLYEMLNPGAMTDPMLEWGDCWRDTPKVPSTAIYSEGDGIVDWNLCVDKDLAAHTENLRVPGSHVGLTHNLAVMYAVAERLAQREGHWRPFDLSGIRGRVYGRTPAALA
ncbi:MAG: pimeloyl-ACP methyl ester carboxylesterase [Zhongshania marina]|jgi:pimeloyl-ACP methyl ester carboxylesterase|uniref:Alpha/beta hydrolase n=1 Tax=Zhongshania marina TaxID=2304603 RepID=A0A2S4HDR1_9GAMM|nr:alpha/beta hydrolase [Marortus luteolus]POP52132.1 alpha/beta hydrolase [Marortus luteolus]RNL66506.1 alpha/beta hydrolase [Zhongshania marina]